MKTIVWYRDHDLRLADHAPLQSARQDGELLALYVLDPAVLRAKERPHRAQLVVDGVRELADGLARRGSGLLVVEGGSASVLARVARAYAADRVVAHRTVDPPGRELERRAAEALAGRLELFYGQCLVAPGSLRTGAGTPYSVFTAFLRAFHRAALITPPLASPRSLPPLPHLGAIRAAPLPTLDGLGLARNDALAKGGESAAAARLRRFVRGPAAAYAERRDRMDLDGTSRLSQDLELGALSARQVWTAVEAAGGSAAFLDELVWREFAHSTLFDRPELLAQPFRRDFIGFPWRSDDALWAAWVEGRTGYPVVDAAARQLLGEGFVHNRARMIAASFLTKHLLIDLRRGEAHYLRYLADGSPAQNDAGWQWSAGCGCDAQPYFRVFNPTVQGERFDPDGAYVRRYVPELARMPARYIHRPHEAPAEALREAGVRLGESYPVPVVEHRFARERFLSVAAEHLGRGRVQSRVR